MPQLRRYSGVPCLLLPATGGNDSHRRIRRTPAVPCRYGRRAPIVLQCTGQTLIAGVKGPFANPYPARIPATVWRSHRLRAWRRRFRTRAFMLWTNRRLIPAYFPSREGHSRSSRQRDDPAVRPLRPSLRPCAKQRGGLTTGSGRVRSNGIAEANHQDIASHLGQNVVGGGAEQRGKTVAFMAPDHDQIRLGVFGVIEDSALG